MNKQKSFTLIELLVVIVIIGILAGVIMISTSSSIDKANLAKVMTFSDSLKNLMLLNLISEWKFDEAPVGTMVKDDWGSNKAVLGDGITSTTYPSYKGSDTNECVSGGCYYFNGAKKDYIITNQTLGIPREGTISIWINGLASEQVTQNIYMSGFYKFCLLGPSNTNSDIRSGVILQKVLGGANDYYNWSGQGFFNGKWHSYIVSWDEQNFYLYKDGAQIGSPIAHNGLPAVDDKRKFIPGGSAWDYVGYGHLTGKIDEVRLYDKLLSTSQVKEIYLSGLNSLYKSGSILKEDYDHRINELAYE